METAFDRTVDPDLIAWALAPAASGSMWLDPDLLGERPQFDRLPGMMSCDLLVVGGGYTGLWTALHAAERNPGSRIVLIESERVGWAASGRNGGFVDPSLTHGAANGKARWPAEFDELERVALANFEGMHSDIVGYGMAVDWERTGMLTVATEPYQGTSFTEPRSAVKAGFWTGMRSAPRSTRRPTGQGCWIRTARLSIPPDW